MIYKNKRIQLISESVKEQLGIEEDESLDLEDEFTVILDNQAKEIKLLRKEFISLSEKIVYKDKRLIILENLIKEDKRRIDSLEKKIKDL